MDWMSALISGGLNYAASTAPVGGSTREYRNTSKMFEKQKDKDLMFHELGNERIDKGFAHEIGMVELGNSLDMANQKEMFDYRIQQGMDQGLTAFEMFMGPAGGAGGGTSSSGATLGNAASQQNMQRQQLEQQMRENDKDRQVKLATTKMQADAQLNSTKLQAAANLGSTAMNVDASKYGTDVGAETARAGQQVTADIAAGKLSLERDVYENRTLPLTAAELKLTEEQTNKVLSEIALNDKDYQRAMKQMSMGVENVYVEGILKQAGVSPTMSQEDWDKIDPKKRAAAMSALAAARSTTARELKGVADILKEFVGWLQQNTGRPPKEQDFKGLGSGGAVQMSPQNRTGNWPEG